MADQPSSRPKRPFRWLLRGFLALVVLALLAVCVLAVMGKVAESRWEKLAAEIRASGQPLTLEEVLASRPSIAPEEDGGPIIHAALEKIQELEVSQKDVFILGVEVECRFEFPERLNARCLKSTREYLGANAPVFSLLDQLLEKPLAYLHIPYKDPMDISGPVLPLISRLRFLSKAVYLDGALAGMDGDDQHMVRDVRVMLRLSQSLYDEPVLLTHLVGTAIDAMAVRLVPDLLQIRVFPDSALAELQDVIDRQIASRSMRMALLGERAHALNFLSAIRSMSGKAPLLSWDTLVPWYSAWYLSQSRVDIMLYYSRLIAAAETSPHALLAKARAEEKRSKKWRFLSTFVSITAPSISNAVRLHLRSLAESRCVIAILASERYRLANGAFPQDLSDLVPAFLDALPADPFDGKPLRLKHEDDGALVIYSIGENETDDGGSINPPQGRGRAPDVGFRLLPPERRSAVLVE
ncbi:MAG: hypothetical protein J5J06_18990 [Phycisphaerae bacterium]|nr:hypothetical protein [Phycisphaerae bacterium]